MTRRYREKDNLQNAWDAFANGCYSLAIQHAITAQKESSRSYLSTYIRGMSLLNLGLASEAFEILDQGIKEYPSQAEIYAALGGVLIELGKTVEAENMLLEAVKKDPKQALAWSNLSLLYFLRSDYPMVIEAATKSLRYAPKDAGARCNLGNALKEVGLVQESLRQLKIVVNENPKFKDAWTSLLFTELFDQEFDPLQHLDIAKKYASTLRTNKIKPKFEKKNHKKITIGILSNDLYHHACAYFLIPLIANINREKFSIILFNLNSIKNDHVTKKFRLISNEFIDLFNMPDEQIIDSVREKDLDVLIDAGGYTGKSPLNYMVHKLAPIQLSWLGYPASSGIAEIDYRISDSFADSDGSEVYYSEKLIRRETVFCTYAPLISRPLQSYYLNYQVKKCPFEKNGYITFGSCNNLAKISDKTIELWSHILRRVPGARLLIEAGNLENSYVKNTLLARMEKFGLKERNLELIPRLGVNQYLTYNKIDIILDTTPLTGGTTTCDALWMGVPVITLVGDYFHTRISGSILNNINFKQLICTNDREYVETAVSLANNRSALKNIRMNLRDILGKSDLFQYENMAIWFMDKIHEIVAGIISDEFNSPNISSKGMFFNGKFYSAENLTASMYFLLAENRLDELVSLLENISMKWPRHWLIALFLSEIERIKSNYLESLAILAEAITLKPDSIILLKYLHYRLLQHGLDAQAVLLHAEMRFNINSFDFLSMSIPNLKEIISVEGGL